MAQEMYTKIAYKWNRGKNWNMEKGIDGVG